MLRKAICHLFGVAKANRAELQNSGVEVDSQQGSAAAGLGRWGVYVLTLSCPGVHFSDRHMHTDSIHVCKGWLGAPFREWEESKVGGNNLQDTQAQVLCVCVCVCFFLVFVGLGRL